MAKAQAQRNLFVSPITAWEAGVANLKVNRAARPNLLGLSSNIWFKQSVRAIDAKILPISQRIAIETAGVPAVYGSGDPGDCFLIATARVHDLILVTRDTNILGLANRVPEYLQVLAC